MRFALVDQAKKDFPVYRLCHVLGVSQSGYFAWKDRPTSRRSELKDDGFAIGRRRTLRLMRDNGLRARQKGRFKRTTDSEHAWPIAPNIIDQDFTATATNQKWGVDISYIKQWTEPCLSTLSGQVHARVAPGL